MPPARVVVIGAGGHGRVVASAILALGELELVGFLDRTVPPGTELLGGLAVLGSDGALEEMLSAGVQLGVIGVGSVGDAGPRARLFRRLIAAGMTPATVIHPSAVVDRYAALGAGSVVLAGAVVNTGARIGANCIVNTGAIIEHDCILGDHVHVSPGAVLGGGCRVGDGSHVGIGATVVQGRSIGRNTLVGAGAVVTRDLGDDVQAVGCPARPVKGRPAVEL